MTELESSKLSRSETKESLSPHPFDILIVHGKNWNKREIKKKNPDHRQDPEFLLSRDSILSTVAAAELYLAGKTKKILFSTGQTREGFPSEARAMYQHLRTFYSPDEIPDDAIELEETSIDSASNAEQVIPLLKGINPENVGILTVGYHTKRIKQIYDNYGFAFPDENILSSEKVLGLDKDPQRGILKAVSNQALELGLRHLLKRDPLGTGLTRKATQIVRK
ncbi:MAG: YdcF family protein [Candidatus Levybacteria bacterium]|nr:YdcF family protein [Candidatus Levybacteria bacterium]